ncbi:aspartate carbamoyltransferase regulatory subunit [Candidatus Woesearchaeota archaeon]|nr:aspartate carbamoyltransferase regulatory subunit [Candidatus Woesearchaeota archaeon]|tara:strand:- start:8169 stop:8618 length:450 start_codon:yes stop_codon:yes gene_type:complete
MKELKINAIREGTVIDHIPHNMTFKVVDILGITDTNNIVSIATNLYSKKMRKKGLVKIGSRFLTKEEVDKIALVAPNASVNIIKNFEVTEKIKVNIPQILNNIIKCSNPRCITNNDKVSTLFHSTSSSPLKVRCHYCERCMGKEDVELL